MSYIRELRALVGNRPLVLAGVSVLVIDKGRPGKILLQRRRDNGCWSNPGGMIEPGESAEDTAVREVAEETGYKIDRPILLTVASGINCHYIYPNGDEVYNVTILFSAETQISKSISKFDDETLDSRWFSLDDLPNDLSPPTRSVLQAALDVPGVRESIHQMQSLEQVR